MIVIVEKKIYTDTVTVNTRHDHKLELNHVFTRKYVEHA